MRVLAKEQWWRAAVGYQIYPRSFADSNSDGNGDLLGILDKLDYLKWLGIDVIWLSPVYPSPMVDNGYDVSDYQNINPLYGTLQDWDNLLQGIHERGMRLIMDLVVNHTSNEHPWFVESRMPDSDKRDWYWWRPSNNGKEPNNWWSRFGGSAWQFDPISQQYYLHLFAPEQPDLNWENAEVRAAIYDVMRWWSERGVDGFRMDVINFVSKDPGLPNVPGQSSEAFRNAERFYVCGPRLHEFLREIRKQVSADSIDDPLLIAEAPAVSVDEARLLTAESRGEVDMLFQFEHMDTDQKGRDRWDEIPFDLPKLKQSLARWQYGLADEGWNSLYLNNHDQQRIVSRWGDEGPYRTESAKLFATVLHLHRGTPFIYQGEEIGMADFPFTHLNQFRDVQTLEWSNRGRERGEIPEETFRIASRRSRDNARTPMQWSDAPYGGFSSVEPWIGVNPDSSIVNVTAQSQDSNSVLSHYRDLIELRHSDPLVTDGVFQLLYEDDQNLWAFIRSGNTGSLITLANVSSFPLPTPLEIWLEWREKEVVVSSHRRPSLSRTLSPWESIVLRSGS